MSSSEIEAGGRLTIDLGALAANWRLLAERAAPAECGAVVKADAYGLGIEAAVPALARAGARTFFVAHPSEARHAREAAPPAAIYVLNGLTPGSAPLYAEIGARPVLGSLPEIEEWTAFARSSGLAGEAAIHIDTGMNRLGLGIDEARLLARRHDAGSLGFRPALVMSHLACADTPDHPMNARQRKTFLEVAALFCGVPASLANSAGTLLAGDYRCDLCRPGIALYGSNPIEGRPNPMQAVVRLELRVIQIRTVGPGESVGYGAGETVRRPSRVAILSAGYADGLIRAAGSSDDCGGAEALLAGRRCPLIGRISMDLIAADVTDLPHGAVRRGDWAVLLGDGISVDDYARHAGTIGYEVLTGLGRRFRRVHVQDGAVVGETPRSYSSRRPARRAP